MAKKSEGSGCLIVIVAIGAIGAIISSVVEWFNDKVNQDQIIIATTIIIVFFILHKVWSVCRYKKRINHLKSKYNNDMWVVNGIMNEEFWKEQTSAQLIDSIGRPLAIDTQVLKTKTKIPAYYFIIRVPGMLTE